jgi:hypothetical protein
MNNKKPANGGLSRSRCGVADTHENTQPGTRNIGNAAGNAVKVLGYGVSAAQGDYEAIETGAAKDLTMSALESDKMKSWAKEAFAFVAKYTPQVTSTIENSKVLKYIPGVAAGAAVLETTVNAGQKYMDGNNGGALTTAIQGGMAAAVKLIPASRLPGVSSFADDAVKEVTSRAAQYAFGDAHPEWVPEGSGAVATVKGAASIASSVFDRSAPYESAYPSTTSFAKAKDNGAPTFDGAPDLAGQFAWNAPGVNVPFQPAVPAPVMQTAMSPRQPQVAFAPTPPRPTGWG